MLLAGTRYDLNAGEIRVFGKLFKQKIESFQPHPRISMDFAVLTAGDKAAGRMVLGKIFPEIHRIARQNLSRGRIKNYGTERLSGGVESEKHYRSFPPIATRSSMKQKKSGCRSNRS